MKEGAEVAVRMQPQSFTFAWRSPRQVGLAESADAAEDRQRASASKQVQSMTAGAFVLQASCASPASTTTTGSAMLGSY